MPEFSAVDPRIGHENLNAVVERDARRDDEKQDGLPLGERLSLLHFAPRHPQREQQHEHRKAEMVGHTHRNHDIGHAHEKSRQQ